MTAEWEEPIAKETTCNLINGRTNVNVYLQGMSYT